MQSGEGTAEILNEQRGGGKEKFTGGFRKGFRREGKSSVVHHTWFVVFK